MPRTIVPDELSLEQCVALRRWYTAFQLRAIAQAGTDLHGPASLTLQEAKRLAFVKWLRLRSQAYTE